MLRNARGPSCLLITDRRRSPRTTQVLLASHGDVGRPTSGVTADNRDLVETSPDRCVQGGVEDPTQMVEVEGQDPVVARGRHTEAVPSTGEISRGRSAPDVGGRAGVTAAVSMEQCLNRAVSSVMISPRVRLTAVATRRATAVG